MTEIPKRLYHVTGPDNEDGIFEKGLTSPWGQYLAGDPEHALRFMADRLRHQFVGTEEREIPLTDVSEAAAKQQGGKIVEKEDGSKVVLIPFPKLRVNDYAVMLEIDRDRIGEPVEVSTDHNPAFFGEDTTSFVVWGKVPPEAIVNVEYYNLVPEGEDA